MNEDTLFSARYSPGGQIVLAPNDPAWVVEFEREASVIRAALVDLEIEIHHIGSTGVGGLPAKPVIDILLVEAYAEGKTTFVREIERMAAEWRRIAPG